MKKRKLMIVIEDTGEHEGQGFMLYMAGDKERLEHNLPEKDLGPAEVWGSRLFEICASALRREGVIRDVNGEEITDERTH